MPNIFFGVLPQQSGTSYTAVVCFILLHMVSCSGPGAAASQWRTKDGAQSERGDHTPAGAYSFRSSDTARESSRTASSAETVTTSAGRYRRGKEAEAKLFSLAAAQGGSLEELSVPARQGSEGDGESPFREGGRGLRKRVRVPRELRDGRSAVSHQGEKGSEADSRRLALGTHLQEERDEDVSRIVASPLSGIAHSSQAEQQTSREDMNKQGEIPRVKEKGRRIEQRSVSLSRDVAQTKLPSLRSVLTAVGPRRKGGKRALFFFVLTLLSFVTRVVLKDNVFNVLHLLFFDLPAAHLLFAGTEPFYFLLYGGFAIYYTWVFYKEMQREQVYKDRLRRVARKEAMLRSRLRNANIAGQEKRMLELRMLLLREEVADMLVEGKEPRLPGVKTATSAGIAFFVLLTRRILGSRVKLCNFGFRYVGALMLLGLARAAVGLWARRGGAKIRRAREETREAIEREITHGTFRVTASTGRGPAFSGEMDGETGLSPVAPVTTTRASPTEDEGPSVENSNDTASSREDPAPEHGRVHVRVGSGGW